MVIFMHIDKKTLDKLMSTDDAALKKQLMQIALAVGMDEKKAASFLNDMPRLKKKAENVTQSDIDKIVSALDSEKLEEIKKAAEAAIKNERKG